MNFHLEKNPHKAILLLFIFYVRLTKLRKNQNEIALKYVFIDQSELTPRIYNFPKSSNIHTLSELLNKSQDNLMKIEHFHIDDVKHILDVVEIEKYFAI